MVTRITLGSDFYPSSSNISTSVRFSEVVYVGSNAADSIKNMNLAGKLVMIYQANQAGGRGFMRNGIYPVLASKGVFGIIMVNQSLNTTNSRNGNMSVNGFRRSITPQLYTISEKVSYGYCR